jgi:glutamate formiminotransferase
VNQTLLAVPNVSEGRDSEKLKDIAGAFTRGGGARLLDIHTDPDHNRSVFTLAGEAGFLARAVADGAACVLKHIDIHDHEGVHPHVGAVDVAPIVHLDDRVRGAACAEALVLADLLGDELCVPVFLYGALAGGRTRAELRRGGLRELSRRIGTGELVADFGPRNSLHATAGASLVAARPPLIAFNVELEPPATVEDARQIAALIREDGPVGLPGLKAIGLWLETAGCAQVSMNVEDHRAAPLAAIIDAIRARSPVRRAELVGLAPREALEAFPDDVQLSPGPRTIEDALTETA